MTDHRIFNKRRLPLVGQELLIPIRVSQLFWMFCGDSCGSIFSNRRNVLQIIVSSYVFFLLALNLGPGWLNELGSWIT